MNAHASCLKYLLLYCLLASHAVKSQNLLRNGDFEQLYKPDQKTAYYEQPLFVWDWYAPTDASIDVFRRLPPGLKAYDSTIYATPYSGDHCLGLVLFSPTGGVEHVSGRLSVPLAPDKLYKISFALRFYGELPCYSRHFGYKLSSDSIVFKSSIIDFERLSPQYPDLFGTHKVYADFQFNDYLSDTAWVRFDTWYLAKGGERFITFGQFAFADDAPVIRQINQMRRMTDAQFIKYMQDNKLLYMGCIDTMPCTRVNQRTAENYYLLDQVMVTPVEEDSAAYYQNLIFNTACIGSDPRLPQIPASRRVHVDPGFTGDLNFHLYARLYFQECLHIQLGNKQEIYVVNTNAASLEFPDNFNYQFTYPAQKLRNKDVVYSVKRLNPQDIQYLQTNFRRTPVKEGYLGDVYWKK